ncbi:hypothetical protein GGF46_004351 [Coemansia sp. RSA 552]|nr:hypothetical protein GGF46_004351 [Coemansia sp. RSA 552]
MNRAVIGMARGLVSRQRPVQLSMPGFGIARKTALAALYPGHRSYAMRVLTKDTSPRDTSMTPVMYEMPLLKQVRHLRMAFLVNVFCSTALSLWVRVSDIYTMLIAGAIVTAGFLPLGVIQIFYYNHIRKIRILGGLTNRMLKTARKAEAAGLSQVQFPVRTNMTLEIEKFSLTGSDPKTILDVSDLVPGPDRKYSIQWLYRSGRKVTKFRVSKRIIQFHPDLRGLDTLIRKNHAEIHGYKLEAKDPKPTK